LYSKLRHTFNFSRDISEIEIIKLIAEYFGVNYYIRTNGDRVDVNLTNIKDCLNLIQFFNKYPLQSRKHQEFLIWRDFVIKAKNFHESNPKLRGSLDNYLPLFFNLIEKLESIRDKI
jgi:hypothetical protein